MILSVDFLTYFFLWVSSLSIKAFYTQRRFEIELRFVWIEFYTLSFFAGVNFKS